jgi:hypothetical protein
MHPRTLAKEDCTGGSCPAVYDDDPDLLPDEIAIVGNRNAPGLRARLADAIAPAEELVVIKRALVVEALRPRDEPVSEAEFSAQFETFSWSAFRLETLQHYVGTGPAPEWAALVRANRRWGKIHHRVHVIAEPLTPAMLEELTEGYPGNVAAGEDIGIITTGPDTWPGGIPQADFWLFDSSRLYTMHYNPDGSWAGASRVHDTERIVEACRVRDEALHRAIPWRAYVTSRPELQSRIAQ